MPLATGMLFHPGLAVEADESRPAVGRMAQVADPHGRAPAVDADPQQFLGPVHSLPELGGELEGEDVQPIDVAGMNPDQVGAVPPASAQRFARRGHIPYSRIHHDQPEDAVLLG
ncbi:hypothetical protein [Amycolatopsis sp. lyj-23]|uniref:hypothetical protein n=1 Tax=Amycolatopsis sp. lyj-23 TaxID=2789283 RepID=UPI00397C016E